MNSSFDLIEVVALIEDLPEFRRDRLIYFSASSLRICPDAGSGEENGAGLDVAWASCLQSLLSPGNSGIRKCDAEKYRVLSWGDYLAAPAFVFPLGGLAGLAALG